MKYRKKPVEVEAIKYISPYCINEMLRSWGNDFDKVSTQKIGGLIIKTLEGEMLAKFGDWVIKGIKGEFYPCKPDIFESTYEPVGE